MALGGFNFFPKPRTLVGRAAYIAVGSVLVAAGAIATVAATPLLAYSVPRGMYVAFDAMRKVAAQGGNDGGEVNELAALSCGINAALQPFSAGHTLVAGGVDFIKMV
jgi:hypothetical protein